VPPNGKPDFDQLHSRVFDRVAVMIAFDLIDLNGKDWAAAPLEERKLRLAQLLRLSTDIQYNGHFDCDGATLFKHVCKLKLKAIVSKRRDYRYRPGPSKAWLKIKNPRSPAMLRMVDPVTMCALRTELGATFGLLLRCSSGRLMRLRSGLLIWDGSRRRDCAGVDETGSSNPGRLIINFV
jgi:ATP dependent DNA ligase domain